MEKINQLMQLDADSSEDVMLRDFVNKRAMLFNETLRGLARHCVNKCNAYETPYDGPASAEQEEPRPIPQFSTMEQVCLAKCESKMVDLTRVVERHVDESFNPAFVKKFV